MVRVPLARTTLVLLTVFLLLPAAAAQTPSAPPCSEIETVHAPLAPLKPGATATYAQTVTNNGNAEVVATVRVTVDGSAWRVSPAEQKVTVPAGESRSADFTVTAPADRAAGDSKLRVNVEGACSLQGNVGPFRTNTVADTQDLYLAEPQGLQVPGLGAVEPEILLGGVVVLGLLGGGFVLARNRGQGFEITCSEPVKRVRPGRGTSFPVEVRNRGSAPDAATFQVGDVGSGWHAFMAVPEVQLAAKESRTIWLMVRSPEDAEPGASTHVKLSVKSRSRPDQPAGLQLRAEVVDEDES